MHNAEDETTIIICFTMVPVDAKSSVNVLYLECKRLTRRSLARSWMKDRKDM